MTEQQPKTEPSEDQPALQLLDWSSVGSLDSKYSLLSELNEHKAPFKPIPTSIFRKASRRWLSLQKQNYYSQLHNSAYMKKHELSAAKAVQDFENYLALVCLMYYGDPHYSGNKRNNGSSIQVPVKRGRGREPLEFLLSPLRSSFPFCKSYTENWSPREIAIFECGMCMFGKEFSVLEKLLGGQKSKSEITQFYHMWKQTTHYKAWKASVSKGSDGIA